jgi:hypothetical protein
MISLILLGCFNIVINLQYETKPIEVNKSYLEKSHGANMKFYVLQIDQQSLKENDLILDSELTKNNQSFKSPVVVLSLV